MSKEQFKLIWMSIPDQQQQLLEIHQSKYAQVEFSKLCEELELKSIFLINQTNDLGEGNLDLSFSPSAVGFFALQTVNSFSVLIEMRMGFSFNLRKIAITAKTTHAAIIGEVFAFL